MSDTKTRIYYTGDMANQPGWFTATPDRVPVLRLDEEPGGEDRTFHVYAYQIGDDYYGHCNPRFVTAEAVAAYRAKRCGDTGTA